MRALVGFDRLDDETLATFGPFEYGKLAEASPSGCHFSTVVFGAGRAASLAKRNQSLIGFK